MCIRDSQVFKILPNDNRGFDFEVTEENAFSVYAKGFDTLPDQRFIKFMPSILVKINRRFGRPYTVARYLGREGTAYTQKAWGKKKTKISLANTLKALWTTEEYDRIPEPLKAIVEKDKVGITIQLDDSPLTPMKEGKDGVMEPMSSVSEEDIQKETDREAARTFWQGKEMKEKGQWIRDLAWIGFGFGVCIVVALLMNWIKIA